MNSAVVNYNALEQERSSELQVQFEQKLAKRLSQETKGLRNLVLQSVVQSRYETAVKDLAAYIDDMEEFPTFKSRIERYQQHCGELIEAIETKRNFPGLSALSVSKQQEIFEKVIEHFDELKQLILRIEATGHEVRLDDIRSTVIFLRSVVYSVTVITALAFALELKGGLLHSYERVMSYMSRDFTNYLFDLLGL